MDCEIDERNLIKEEGGIENIFLQGTFTTHEVVLCYLKVDLTCLYTGNPIETPKTFLRNIIVVAPGDSVG